MADISKFITQLDNPNWNKRYNACEELRVAEKLPEEALIALQKATNDPVPSVADAARSALLVHTDTNQDSAEIQSLASIQEQVTADKDIELNPLRFLPELIGRRTCHISGIVIANGNSQR